MKVLALATQKGGTGKSTLAASLAVEVAARGKRVLAIDADARASLWIWSKRREDRATPLCVWKAVPRDVPGLVTDLRQDGQFDLVIIDAPGKNPTGEAIATRDVDLCLIPVKPSITDFDALFPRVDVLRRLRIPFAAVLSLCNPMSPVRTTEAATTLAHFFPVSPIKIAERTDYLDADMLGKGVTEFNPSGRAAQEIRRLWEWTSSELKEAAMPSDRESRGEV